MSSLPPCPPLVIDKVTYYSIGLSWTEPVGEETSEEHLPSNTSVSNIRLEYTLQQGLASAVDIETGRGFVTVYEGPDFAREITGLEMSTAYSFRVRCSNIFGPSEWSPIVTTETRSRVISSEYVHRLIAHNDVSKLQEVLQDYPSFLDTKDLHGRSTLMAACSLGKEEMVQFLLDSGADMHFQTGSGKTCLMEACNYGRNGCVLLLHKANMKWSTEDSSGLTALHWAVLGGHSDTVELLLSTLQIPVDIIGKKNSSKLTPLLYLASVGGNPSVAKVLLLYKAKVNCKDVNGNTALMIAAASHSKSNYELIVVLLNFNADPLITSKYGHTALDYAKSADKKNVVKLLQDIMKQ